MNGARLSASVIASARQHTADTTQEGRVFLYLGPASGLAPTPAWTAEGTSSPHSSVQRGGRGRR